MDNNGQIGKQRLDKALVERGLAPTRSQAEHLVSLGEVRVRGVVATKSGQMVSQSDEIKVTEKQRYVSRAGLKLASVVNKLSVQFDGATVLHLGSSTGGFTDYALRHGARRVIAVDVGTDQLHPSLHGHPQIDLHEKTDIRDFTPSGPIDIVLIDVSFISIRKILPTIYHIPSTNYQVLAMVKPQFEARRDQLTRSGIVKNDRARRDILKDFEQWASTQWKIVGKADSDVAGTHGNRERFYKLNLLKTL